MRAALCVWLLLACAGLGLAQPTSTPSPYSELNELVRQHLGEEEEARPPSAKDYDKPAVFGVMIASRLQDRAGTSIGTIRRASIMPWALSALLLPLYLIIARRRGFVIRKSQP